MKKQATNDPRHGADKQHRHIPGRGLWCALALVFAAAAFIAPTQVQAQNTPGNLTAVTIGGVDALAYPNNPNWTWDNATNTLSLYGYVTGDIVFTGTAQDWVNIVTGRSNDVNVTGQILCHAGPLSIGTTGGGNLNVSYEHGGSGYNNAIRADNGLTLKGVVVNATASSPTGRAVFIVNGGFTMSGGGRLEANGHAAGIHIDGGDMNISGTSAVMATSTNGRGIYVAAGSITKDGTGTLSGVSNFMGSASAGIYAGGSITINGGNVSAGGRGSDGTIRSGTGGITVNGGSLTVQGSNFVDGGSIILYGGWVGGNLTVTGAEAYVYIQTSVVGNLTVSGGTVKVGKPGERPESIYGDLAVSGGAWSGAGTVYTIPYSGLAYSTAYTVGISGFKDAALNTMAASSAYSFTTEDEPLTLVSAAAVGGVVAPVAGAAPSTAVNGGTGFTASLSWDGNPATFAYGTAYTATITLTAATGYTFSGGFANTAQIAGFTVGGIAPVWVSNNGSALVFKVRFPATAAAPVITIDAQPVAATSFVQGAVSGTLTVEASATEDAVLSYQWYSNAENANTGGTAIEGATAASFTIPTALTAGTYYYYCTVSAKDAEPVVSTVAVVTVAPAPAVPVFHGLADEYTAGSAAVPLRVVGTGSASLTVFKVNGTTATEFNPTAAGTYTVEAVSSDGKLKIWKYVKVK